MPKNRFLKLTTFFYAGLALLTFALDRFFGGTLLPFFRVPLWRTAGLTVIAAGLPMAVVWLLVRLDFVFMRRILEKLYRIKPLLIELNQAERIYIALLAGFSEELLFRGCLQPLWGIAAASLIFGLLHAFTFGYFLLAAAMGLYLGVLLQIAGNLLAPMAVHALYDLFALNLLARIYLRQKENADVSR